MCTVLSCAVILALCVSETIAQSCMDTRTDSDEEGQPFKKCGSSKNVGRISPLIINGTEAQLGSFPWHAGLYHLHVQNGTESWEQGCGGSLITDQFVLTAAHCVKDVNETDVRVALGKIYRSWDEDECSQQKRNVSKIIYPFEFNHNQFCFDIALLLLDEKVKLGELVMPVCTGLQGGSDYLRNQQLFIAGWGKTQNDFSASASETLLYTEVMFIPKQECLQLVNHWVVMFERFCVRKNNSAESVVQGGDSGGGLTVVNEGLHYIFGIVSVKYTNSKYQTSIITNATYHNHIYWIENEIRKYDASYSWYGDETATKDSSRPGSFRLSCEGCCRLPRRPQHGAYFSHHCSSNDPQTGCRDQPGTLVPPGTRLRYTCVSGYSIAHVNTYSSCEDGGWKNELDCTKCGVRLSADDTPTSTDSLRGNSVTKPMESPWVVTIYTESSVKGLWKHLCMGTLVSPHLVVVAAHCLFAWPRETVPLLPNKLRVAFGKTRPSKNSTVYRVNEVVIPERFNNSRRLIFKPRDIALLDVAIPEQTAANIMPACLDRDQAFRPVDDAEGVVVGWPRWITGNREMVSTQLKFIGHDRCLNKISPNLAKLLPQDSFCAENPEADGRTSADADVRHRSFVDGGGLTFPNTNGQHFLIGVSSIEKKEEPVLFFTDITNIENIAWLEVDINRLRQSHREL